MKFPKLVFLIRISRKALFVMFIFGSIIANFTALYILRMWIIYVQLVNEVNKTHALITIADRMSQVPLVFYCTTFYAYGIITMFVLMWALGFGEKTERRKESWEK